MRIVVITDVHSNLPALEAVLKALRTEEHDLIFHTGDAVGIGPYPAECLDLLLNTPRTQFVMGNHDAYFVEGIPKPQPPWMSDGEVEHQRWTHTQLDSQLRSVLGNWPYVLKKEFEGVKVTFAHYGLKPSGRDFASIIKEPTATDLDGLFALDSGTLLFFGHLHRPFDVEGRARYVNPGSLGCCERAIARYSVVEFHRGQYSIEHRSIRYDDAELFKTFEQRRVPERQFIYQAFLGGRYH